MPSSEKQRTQQKRFWGDTFPDPLMSAGKANGVEWRTWANALLESVQPKMQEKMHTWAQLRHFPHRGDAIDVPGGVPVGLHPPELSPLAFAIRSHVPLLEGVSPGLAQPPPSTPPNGRSRRGRGLG